MDTSLDRQLGYSASLRERVWEFQEKFFYSQKLGSRRKKVLPKR
ncbi:hypothetical protein ACMAUO_03650 [Gluconacetobacter sp. Hr-1-5]